jgi:hypothetical protein
MHVHGRSTAYAGEGAGSDDGIAGDDVAGANDDEAVLLAHPDGADEGIGRLMRELTPGF